MNGYLVEAALNLIQEALTKLSENTYNSAGDSVMIDLEKKTGKRIDMKG